MASLRPLAALALVAGCGAMDPAGTYQAIRPAANDGGEQHLRVMLRRDGFASVTSAFTGRPSRFLAEGTWAREGNRISVKLDKSELIAKEWDPVVWGEAGPGVLWRVR
jgi:hypothetical protein